MRAWRRWLCGGLVGLLLLVAACGDDDPTQPPPGLPTGVVPDFEAVDVNEASGSAGTTVSPRDQLAKVSAWYFGHAT